VLAVLLSVLNTLTNFLCLLCCSLCTEYRFIHIDSFLALYSVKSPACALVVLLVCCCM